MKPKHILLLLFYVCAFTLFGIDTYNGRTDYRDKRKRAKEERLKKEIERRDSIRKVYLLTQQNIGK